MSKRTRPHKRSKVKKIAKRKTHGSFFSRYSSRAKIVAAMIVSVVLAAASVAYWKVPGEKVAPAPAHSEAMSKAPVKNVSTLSASELADIPPEAFTRQPPADIGYNAHNGGLPPGALPPGVVLPGMSMMQGGQGYGGYDGVRQQFTSKERDNETGLDYFGARYYSSTQGRFTSPDEFSGGPQEVYTLGKGDPEKQALPYADITNPQSLNKYTYAYNNPLRFVDANGHCPLCIVVAVVAILASAEYVNAPGPNDPIYPSGTGQRDLVSNIFIGEATGAAGRVMFAPLMSFAAGKLFANEAVGQVESRILANAAQGRAFENRVLGIIGETKNTTRIMQGEATGAAYRVPDILTQKIGNVAGEIKSTTGSVQLTSQFKDLLSYAAKNNTTLRIYLTPEAKLAPKLIPALKQAGTEVYDVVGDKIVRRKL